MFKVLGIEKGVVYDFDDKVRKVHVHSEGLRLHLCEERKGVEGVAVDKPIFVSNEKSCYAFADSLKVGDMINVGYNRFGKFETITK